MGKGEIGKDVSSDGEKIMARNKNPADNTTVDTVQK